MTCEQFKRDLDGMDKCDLSPAMEKHVSDCSSCSRLYMSLHGAEAAIRLPLLLCSKDLVPKIMAMLPFMQKPRRVMALRNWLAVGLFLMASVAFIPFLEAFKMLKDAHGNGFLIPLGIVTGLAVSLYLIIFSATHVEDFSRRFGIRKHA